MSPSHPTVSRRAVLGAAVLLPLAGCTGPGRPDAASTPGPTTATASAPTAAAASEQHDHLVELERRFDARLGVYALATGTGDIVAHRADERFAFCSVFKGLAAAAVLSRNPMSRLAEVVAYTEDDVLPGADISRRHLATGMSLGEVCDAAVRHSDGTAGNLLLRLLGGPGELTAYLRGLGDTVTRSDRTEPTLSEAVPGDLRDTTTPRAIGDDYHQIVLGDALQPEKRDFLRDLLERAETIANKRRIRAGVPAGWTVADKTGTGSSYGAANDVAIVSPPNAAPLVVAVMTAKATEDASSDDALLAEAAKYVVTTLT